MAINITSLESALQTKLNAATGSTESKEFLLLTKSLESLNSGSIVEVENLASLPSASTNTGRIIFVTSESSLYFSNGSTWSSLDPQSIVDGAPAALNTLNELAAALNDDANFATTVTNSIATKMPLAGGTFTGAVTGTNLTLTGDLTVQSATSIREVKELVTTDTSTSGTLNFDMAAQGILYLTSSQTANRTINFQNTNSIMAVGQSMTVSVLATQGGTAYYFSTVQVDGSTVTPKWAGGSAPTEGNASGIDVYTFTIIKTANATFTVLTSQTQYA